MKVLLVEDHIILRESFSVLLNSTDNFEVVASSDKATEALSLCDKYHPDIVLDGRIYR